MKTSLLSSAVLSLCALSYAGDHIPFCQLPPCAQAAVYRVAPGIRVEYVEVENKRGWTVFEVEGHCPRFEYEIKVTPQGQILKVDRDDR